MAEIWEDSDFWGAADIVRLLPEIEGLETLYQFTWLAKLKSGAVFMLMRSGQEFREEVGDDHWRQISPEHLLGILEEIGFDDLSDV